MPSPYLLRAPLIGDDQSGNVSRFVLVHITGQESPSLELHLLATEESHVYKATFRSTQMSSSRAKSYKGADEEWRAVLGWVFLRQPPDGEFEDFVRKVEIVTTVDPGKQITLVLRQMVSGIAQRLGTFILNCDDEQEIQLFDWAGIAANAALVAEQASLDIEARFKSQSEIIGKLNKQLQEFIEAKERQESELINKFRLLLNSKKAKIRDQMRLLSTARVDADAATRVRSARGQNNNGSSAAEKRKRKASIEIEESDLFNHGDHNMAETGTMLGEIDSDDAFERAETPPRSDEGVTDNEDAPAQPQIGEVRGKIASKGLSVERGHDIEKQEAADAPPPKRDLPFITAAGSLQSEVVPNGGDVENEDDETDDEL